MCRWRVVEKVLITKRKRRKTKNKFTIYNSMHNLLRYLIPSEVYTHVCVFTCACVLFLLKLELQKCLRAFAAERNPTTLSQCHNLWHVKHLERCKNISFLEYTHVHTHTLDKQQNAKGNALENLNKNRVGAENALTAEGGVSRGACSGLEAG